MRIPGHPLLAPALVLLAAPACDPSTSQPAANPVTNVNVTGPSTSPLAQQQAAQSETRIARTIYQNPATGEDVTRLILAYNDGTPGPVDSLEGWAWFEPGQGWNRQPQLPIPPAGAGVARGHGDPWLAAFGATVFYSAMSDVDSAVTRVVVARSDDGGRSWLDPVVVGEDAAGVDGPKIALTRDGRLGMVSWLGTYTDHGHEAYGPWYAVFYPDHADALTNLAEGPLPLHVLDVADPPVLQNCPNQQLKVTTLYAASPHPTLAGGEAIYLAMENLYYDVDASCPAEYRWEVYRYTPPSWERILSLPFEAGAPLERTIERDECMLGAVPEWFRTAWEANHLPAANLAYGACTPVIPAFEVAAAGETGDVALFAVTRQQDPQASDELYRQKITLYRMEHADDCTAATADQGACDWTSGGQNLARITATEPDLDDLERLIERLTAIGLDAAGAQRLRHERAGVYQYSPALFVGGAGRVDHRVGLFWYEQPYRGLRSYTWSPPVGTRGITAEQRSWTIVAGVLSADAGRTWGPVALLTVANGEADTLVDAAGGRLGQYFVPCPTAESACDSYDAATGTCTLTGTHRYNGRFGDYMGGAFASANPSDLAAVVGFSDSRLGCFSVNYLGSTYHQHVYVANFR